MQPGAGQGAASRSRGRVATGPRMGLPIGGLQAARRDVGVDLGRGQVLVAEQLLDDPQVGAAVEQVGRERMAQRVRRDADRQAGARAQAVEAVAQAADAERPRRGGSGRSRPAAVRLVRRAGARAGPAGRPRDRRRSAARAGRPSSPIRSLRPLPRTRSSPRRRSSEPRSAAASSLMRRPAAYAVSTSARSRRARATRSAARSGSVAGRASRSSSTTARSRATCSTSSTCGRRRGSRGVAIAPHGSPGARSLRVAQRWNERIAASRCATVERARPSPSTPR